jgi:mannose-1-phosphate guanylyltransferase
VFVAVIFVTTLQIPVSCVSMAVKTRNNHYESCIVPAAFEWDDLGSWDALGRMLDTDADGNAHMGDTLAIDTTDSVLATDGHLSAVGVDGLVVASFDDRTLIIPREQSQRVRDVVESLRERETAGDRNQ